MSKNIGGKKTMVALADVPAVAITLVLVAAIFVAGFLVTDGLDDSLTANSYAANATDELDEGMYNVVEYAPTWGTLIGVGVLLAIVLGAFYVGRKYTGGGM